MSWRTLFLENYLPGDLCSGLIICWRKSSGEMSPGEKFLGEKCDEFPIFFLHGKCPHKQTNNQTCGQICIIIPVLILA